MSDPKVTPFGICSRCGADVDQSKIMDKRAVIQSARRWLNDQPEFLSIEAAIAFSLICDLLDLAESMAAELHMEQAIRGSLQIALNDRDCDRIGEGDPDQ